MDTQKTQTTPAEQAPPAPTPAPLWPPPSQAMPNIHITMPSTAAGAWSFVLAHWRLMLSGLGALVAFWLGSRRGHDTEQGQARVRIEEDAAQVASAVATIAAEKGAAAAHQVVADQYAQTLQHLSDAQAKQAQALMADPQALAAFLVSSGASKGGGQ